MNLLKPIVLLSLCCVCVCQEQKPAPKADPAPKAETQEPDAKVLLAEMMAKFKEQHIDVDLKAKTVTIPVVVNYPQDPFEYLLIHKRGKRHEAVFYTEVQPSVLNGALLLLGLEKGKNATVEPIEPMPSQEEVMNGAETTVIKPAEGEPFWMTVKWTTPEGKAVEYCVEDLLLDLTTQEPVGECKWVYLGGRMARIYKNDPEVYVADYEGNLISICYLMPDNHLATMVHERAPDDQNWWTTNLVPEPETKLSFVFHKQRTKLHEARAKRLEAARKAKEKEAGAEKK